MAEVYYDIIGSSCGAEVAAREIQIGRCAPTVNVGLSANLNAQGDLLLLNPRPSPLSRFISAIRTTTVRGGPERYPPDHQQPCEAWLFVLRDEAENYFVPEPRELGLNGSFAVFKMIETDVIGFENYLQSN